MLVASSGCRNAQQVGLDRLAELGVNVNVRESRIGPDTYSVAIYSSEGLDEAFVLLDECCRPLQRLTIRNCTLTPVHFHQISLFEELERLTLYGVPIGENAAYLADLKKLRALNIAGSDAGDEQLAALRPALIGVESLAVGPDTTDDGLQHVQLSSKLHTLFLGDTQVTGVGLSYVPASSLRSLWLDRSRFGDEYAEELLRFKQLQRLGLSELPITDATALIVAQSQSLDYVSLENTHVTDASINALAKMPLLYILDTPGSQITPDGIARLKKLRPDVLIGSDPLERSGAEGEH